MASRPSVTLASTSKTASSLCSWPFRLRQDDRFANVAGLEDVTDGEIEIAGRVVNDLSPRERDIAMVFQNYALYPHMTVAENISFSLLMQKLPKAEIGRKVSRVTCQAEIHESATAAPVQPRRDAASRSQCEVHLPKCVRAQAS
jgi:ABC-type Fe3+/spermidine/putrescine transport system ATPase subunit